MLAALDGTEPGPAQLAAPAPYLAADEPVAVGVRAGRAAATPPSTLAAALVRLTRQALEQLPDAPLGACGDAECRMAYLDPGGRRRWCSPERCGVKARARAHRARTRSGAGPE